MRLQLVVTRGPDMGTVFELEMVGTYVLGRGDDCSIQLSDARISRHHCRMVVTGGKAQLEDSNSSWGTIVNGKTIDSQQLQPGDIVKLVETEMRFEVATSAAATTWQPDQPASLATAQEADAQKLPQTTEAPVGPPPRQTDSGQPSARPIPPPTPAADLPAAKPKTDAPSPESVPHEQPVAAPQLKSNDLSNLVGQKIARYEITDVIARARTGMLFRAHDAEKDRQVALKVMWPEMTRDDDELQRFVRAVKTVIGVKHPNLVTLHGAGKSPPRYCWTASELVEGDSLMDVMIQAGKNGQLPWQQCLRVAVHIARALEAAAAKGFVHRNITPTNILIRKRDGVAKLGDLMLAKALEGTQAERITRPGETVGDIPYLSPEQLLAQHKVDSRSDIYGLGASIYAAVTGRPPVEGKSVAQTISLIETQIPEDPRNLNASIPPHFASAILRMLEKKPDGRFATPSDLVSTLENIVSDTGLSEVALPDDESEPFADGEVSIRGVYAWIREIPWPVRRNLMIGMGLLVIAVLVGSALGSLLNR